MVSPTLRHTNRRHLRRVLQNPVAVPRFQSRIQTARPSKLQLERARLGVTPPSLRCGTGEFMQCVNKTTPQGIVYPHCWCGSVGGSIESGEQYQRVNPISMAAQGVRVPGMTGSQRRATRAAVRGGRAPGIGRAPVPTRAKGNCLGDGLKACADAGLDADEYAKCVGGMVRGCLFR